MDLERFHFLNNLSTKPRSNAYKEVRGEYTQWSSSEIPEKKYLEKIYKKYPNHFFYGISSVFFEDILKEIELSKKSWTIFIGKFSRKLETLVKQV